jgi:uncharacterized protein GlcG (DUF336 family)
MSTDTQSSTITRRHISLSAAERVVAAAKEKAAEIGVPAAIAVVDAEGTLKAFARMDGAALLPVRIAQQKAWTAISFGISTADWWEMVSNDEPLLHGIVHQQDVIVFAGGVPITEGGEVVGGVGISGGHHSQDHEIAEAAAAAL